MKTVGSFFLALFASFVGWCQSCVPGASIRVGTDCSCNTCSNVTVMSLESYVSSGLDNEWIPSWNTESLKAGAVAYRSYGAYYIEHPYNGTYDLSNTTCKQVWESGSSSSCVSASIATIGQVLSDGVGGPISRSEYAAETNGFGCGDGFTGCLTCGTPLWPCIADDVCVGKASFGHWRGMCQWGSQRWATSGRNYAWILAHYYNPANVYLCSGSSGCAPSTTNDYCFGPPSPPEITVGSFSVSVSGTTCGATASKSTGSSCSASGLNSNVPDVWYKFVANNVNHNISVKSGENFDAVVEIYSSACGTQIGSCTNSTSTGGVECAALTGATIGASYYVRVYDYWENTNSALIEGADFTIRGGGCVASTNDVVLNDFIDIRPNPTKGEFTISASGKIGEVNVRNLIGGDVRAKVRYVEDKSVEVDIAGQFAGVYFINVEVEGQLIRQKLLKID